MIYLEHQYDAHKEGQSCPRCGKMVSEIDRAFPLNKRQTMTEQV